MATEQKLGAGLSSLTGNTSGKSLDRARFDALFGAGDEGASASQKNPNMLVNIEQPVTPGLLGNTKPADLNPRG